MTTLLLRIIFFFTSITWFLLQNNSIRVYISWSLWEFNILEFSFLLDRTAMQVFFCVILITIRVLGFSHDYILLEKYNWRFHLLLISFVRAMVILVFRANFARILLGWDGLGLTSYFLVVFYQNSKSNKAGLVTALTNRVGDCFLLVSLSLRVSLNSWRYSLWGEGGQRIILIQISVLVIVAACTKRAQVPFSAWLPAAIAAPTPVSSLVHSSTLVTAGVYLLCRFHLRLHSTTTPLFLLVLGLITALGAGLCALVETDIKKIIALSTLSQLGIIIIGIGLRQVKLALFHLVVHAFFKALIFISIGNLIHISGDFQDLRRVSVTVQTSPLTYIIFFCSVVRLSGIPFFSGFFSKDLLLEETFLIEINFFIYITLYLTAVLTLLYSLRLLVIIGRKTIKSYVFINQEEILVGSTMSMLFLTPWALTRATSFQNELLYVFLAPGFPIIVKIFFLFVIFFRLIGASAINFHRLKKCWKLNIISLNAIFSLSVVSSQLFTGPSMSASRICRFFVDLGFLTTTSKTIKFYSHLSRFWGLWQVRRRVKISLLIISFIIFLVILA